ncbi:MAG TPA: DUF1178 family protein [Rhodocyclaceae bacterium]|nr:DUF1178 family protein [Rhodocyclaceae bacterium]
MIVLDLTCTKDHRFEGWFASHDDFERQHTNGLVTCPLCATREVRKLPSAPHVQRSSNNHDKTSESMTLESSASDVTLEHSQMLAQLLSKLRESAAQSEDVGKNFPEEARRIHRGDAEERAIKGEASLADLESLLEEGISVLPVPPAKEDLH